MSEAFVWPELKAAPADGVSGADAQRRAEEAGRAAGFERGLEEGREAARAELGELRERLRNAVEMLDGQLLELRDRKVESLAQVVHALCRRVLGCELTTSAETVERILAEGVSRLEADGGQAEVYVNSEDHAAIAAVYQGQMPLHADPEVPPCGLSVRLPTQAADFQPMTLIDELFEDLRDDLGG